MSVAKAEGDVSILDFHYLIAERDKDVKYINGDRNELGLFSREETLEFMEKAGFDARFLEKGLLKDRGLFVGVKL